jgi:hypothetical protein
VFDAWAKIHAVVRGLCDEPHAKLAWALHGNLNHVVIHTSTIERLLGVKVDL